MTVLGANSPMVEHIEQVPAETRAGRFLRFVNCENHAKQASATGYFSREPLAERQNRYPSPMQGPDTIPIRSLYFRLGHGGAAKRLARARLLPDSMCEPSQNKGFVGCERNLPSSPVLACWALPAAATPCWSKACSEPGQAPLARQLSAATRPLARLSARAQTFSVRTSRTLADNSGGLTTRSHHLPGHPRISRAGGLSFAKTRPATGQRAALGTS